MPGPADDTAPHPEPTASTFEGRVIRFLSLRLGVALQTREDWDLYEMTDFVVMSVDGLPMPFRTEVQLTKQGGNLHKLERFVRISEGRRDVMRVYIVPASWHRSRDAAYAVRSVLRMLRKAKTPGVRAFFLDDPPPAARGLRLKQFNARKRIEFLRRRCDPANPRRRTGVIASIDLARQRLIIRDGEGREHLALMGDAEGPLAAALKRRRSRPDEDEVGPAGWRVSFVPHVEDRGPHHGRLRALSVIFPPRP